MLVDDLQQLVSEALELDDTRNNVEVAFAIDKILRRPRLIVRVNGSDK